MQIFKNMLAKLLDIKNRLGTNPELKQIYIGMLNFYSKSKNAEILAKKRYLDSCKNCTLFVDEKNELLQIKDTEIPELTNKNCYICGCVCSFKLRQSINKCDKWKI